MNTAFWLDRDCLEDLCIGERIILQLILKKYVGRAWTGFIWLRTETNDEHSNDLQISYSVDNFLTIPGLVTFSRGTLLHENFLCEVLTMVGIRTMLLWDHIPRQL